jgi:hypothetical protein
MKENPMNRKWLYVAALSVSFAGLPALTARATDTVMKMRDVPERVKQKIDDEAKGSGVKSVTLVEYGDRKFYRVVLDKRGPEDQVLRISPAGELLSADVERDVRANARDATPAERSGRAHPTEARPAAQTAADNEGEAVNYDDLPGGIKSTIGREARNQKIERVTKYQHRGQTIYRAVIGDENRQRVVRVAQDGSVYHEEDVTPPGGKVVDVGHVPGVVKQAVLAEAKSSQITKVYQFTRGSTTHYRVVLDNGRNYDVTDTGKIVQVDDNGAPSSETATPARRRR